MQRLNLTTTQVRAALPRVSVGLAKYEWLQKELPLRNVSSDGEYQKRFGGNCRVRCNFDSPTAFFQILER